jgi:hypothetical protein
LEDVHELVSFLDSASVDGTRRVCRIAEGAPVQGELHEVILAVDDGLRRVAYSILESPFGFSHHAASMQIVEEEGQTWFVWTTDILPDSVAEQMTPLFHQEADHIAQQLQRSS